MASNPLFIITDFFCMFQKNLAMATLDLKEMGKFLLEGRLYLKMLVRFRISIRTRLLL